MKARCTTLQEMKAYRCEHCSASPSYQVIENNSHGITVTAYLCENHYTDFRRQQIKAHMPEYCERCGKADTNLQDSPIFGGSNPSKLYRLCPPCKLLQENLAEEEFAVEEPDAPEDSDNRELDDTKYDDF